MADQPLREISETSQDVSQFIRTYAKDVAAQTGAQTASVSKFQEPVVTEKKADDDGVSLPEFDASPVQHAEAASPKEFAQEVVDLPSMEEAKESVAPSAPAPQAPSRSTEHLAPVMAQAPIADAPTETPEKREEILARLRAKVAARATPLPVPVQRAPEPLPAFEKSIEVPVVPAPAFVPRAPDAPRIKTPSVVDTYKEPVPVATPIFVPPPILPTPPPARAANVPTVPSTPSGLHTYSGDFADRIDSKNASQFSVLAAESDAAPKVATPTHTRGPLFIVAGVVLIVLALGGAGVAFVMTHQMPLIASQPTIRSLVVADEYKLLPGTGTTLLQNLEQVAGQPLATNTVLVTYVLASSTETTGASSGDFVQALALPAPDILLRNVDPSSTVGVVHAPDSANGTDESRAFFVFKVSSYERTFAGMLAWEPQMHQDLLQLYPDYQAALPAQEATTTATSTKTRVISSPLPGAAPFFYQFTDAVVANHDVRILKDAQGRSLMVYGYRDKQTLIIARDPAAFTLLLSKLHLSS